MEDLESKYWLHVPATVEYQGYRQLLIQNIDKCFIVQEDVTKIYSHYAAV